MFEQCKPDIIVLLGDRYEILASAIAALTNQIPIAHLHGGELSEGVIDDSIRHAITKMSNLHFVASAEYRRVIQLGESPGLVYNFGALGIENILRIKLYNLETLSKELNIKFLNKNLLVTFHPVINEELSPAEQIRVASSIK